MKYPWTYNKLTQTVLIYHTFNEKLTGLPLDAKIINFEDFFCSISWFNQPIHKKDFPPNVQYIKFGCCFNQPVNKDSFPNFLTHLTFGERFNQPVNKDSFPNSITHLIFGENFNQPVNKDSFPSSITHLTFGWFFKQPVNELPDNLIFLELPTNYNCVLDNLPYGLKTLVISQIYPIANKVPFGCEIKRKY
jgi:hypothetical protein